MKTLVTYVSLSGNTKKVAEAIYSEIPGEKELKPLVEVVNLDGYGVCFIGSPIHAYGPSKDVREFLEKNAPGKKVALFITHASPENNGLLSGWLQKCKDAAAGASLLGCFNCQGELARDIADFMEKSSDANLVAWAKRRPETLGMPDEIRLERARAFSRQVMSSI